MAEMTAHAPGTFCWVELDTTDPAGAKRFYGELLGWSAVDVPVGEGMTYTLLKLRGLDAGALYGMPDAERAQGVPPHWNSYVAVADADASAAKARALGGTLLMEPFDVADVGRMAVVRDPQGAVLAVWQPGRNIGVRVKGEAGALCWNELATPDPAGARAFYGGLFGWKAHEQEFVGNVGTYTSWLRGDREQPEAVGGMYRIDASMGPIPPHWMVYFMVDDADATIAKAAALGGRVVVPAFDVAGVGRIAMLADPQGAHFSVIRPAM